MHSPNTKLEINLENDLKQLIITITKKAGYQLSAKSSTEQNVRHYFNLILREIPMQPRRVHISRELAASLPSGSLKIAFDRICNNASTVGKLNTYLSTEILNPGFKDLLLFDWGIHHLHLGTTQDKGNPLFMARTKELLYAKVQPEDFYCIAMLDHCEIDGFANQQLIQIIYDNWPHLLERFKVRGLPPQPIGSLTNEDIHKVRSAGVTTFVTVADGTTFMPSGGGYASDGSSLQVTRMSDMLLGKIRCLEAALINEEIGLRNQISAEKGHCPRTIKITMQSWDESAIHAFERKTKSYLRIPWIK